MFSCPFQRGAFKAVAGEGDGIGFRTEGGFANHGVPIPFEGTSSVTAGGR